MSAPRTFKVFEKDAAHSARRQGYGLTLNRGWAALEKLGLAEAARAEDTPSSAHYVFGKSGDLINVFSSKDFGRASGGGASSAASSPKHLWERRRNLIMPRQRLRELLLEQLASHGAGGDIQWGWEYCGHRPRDDGRLSVEFEQQGPDGVRRRRAVAAGVLVGADGLWSRVRDHELHQLQPGANRLDYLGVLVVLGIAPSDHPLCEGNTFQILDGKTRLYSMPFSAGATDADRSTFWQLSFECDEQDAQRYRDDAPALMHELRRRCDGWHEPVPSLLAHTPTELISSYPVYDRGESYPFPSTHPALLASQGGRVTLLGDAAHPMSPFKAQGANQALMDAIQLADALSAADLGRSTKSNPDVVDVGQPTDLRLGSSAGTRTGTEEGQRSSPEALLREYERQMFARSEPQRTRSLAAVADLHSLDVRVAATTGKGGPPCEELLGEFRRAHIGCWDSEHAPSPSKTSRRLRTRLDQKIVDARKAVRRKQTRRRVKLRAIEEHASRSRTR